MSLVNCSTDYIITQKYDKGKGGIDKSRRFVKVPNTVLVENKSLKEEKMEPTKVLFYSVLIFVGLCVLVLMNVFTAPTLKAQANDDGGIKTVSAQQNIQNSAKLPEDTIEIKYQRLSEKLRTMSLPIWQKLVRKERTDPIITALVWIGILGFSVFLNRHCLKIFKKIPDDQQNKKGRDLWAALSVLSTATVFILIIFCIFLAGSALKSLFNPEYYVIEELMEKLK